MALFVVTEVYLPLKSKDPNGAGVRTLAVFNNVQEANRYALAHVTQSEYVTRLRSAKDGGEDEFRGRYLGTTPSVDVYGCESWEVDWQNLSMISVERLELFDEAASELGTWDPMSWCTIGGPIGDVVKDSEGEAEGSSIKYTPRSWLRFRI